MKLSKSPVNRRFWAGICSGFPLLPALSVSEWAQSYRVLSRESTAKSGKWDNEEIPYQVEPMDAFNDPSVSEVVLMWAAQTGKSEILNNVLGFFAHADPSPQLLVQPTIELAEAYSKERIAPMIRDTPILRQLVKDPRSRDSGNTLLSKVYPGGNLALVGANAPSGLAGRPRRVVLKDEVDRYPESAGSEGDPSALADKRAESFPNAVKGSTSTPGLRGASRIEKKLEASDCRKLHLNCPRCGHEQVLAWAQIKWPEGKPEDAYLECANEQCKAQLTDEERVTMIRKAGKTGWKPTRPFTGIRGYWLPGMNTLFAAQKGFKNRLHQMAMEFLAAKDGGRETVKTWVNTFLAETYEEAGEQIDSTALQGHAEPYNGLETLPRGILILTAGFDVQGDRIEVGIDGWGADEECWSICYRVLYGDPRKDEVWKDLDKLLTTEFTHASGMKMRVERVFGDTGYAQDRVLAFTGPRAGRGVYGCKGINRVGTNVPPLLPSRPSRNNKWRMPFWPVGVTVAKHAIYSRLVMLPGGARTIHFPVATRADGSEDDFGFNGEYFKQLTAEKQRTRYSFGVPYYVYEKDNNSVRNEAIDVRVYSFAALHSLGRILWHKLQETIDQYERENPKKEKEDHSGMGGREDQRTPADGRQFGPGQQPHHAEDGESHEQVLQDGVAPIIPEKANPVQPPRPFVPRRPRAGGWAKGW
jgi:phage terminase large subunit GpA-like protein